MKKAAFFIILFGVLAGSTVFAQKSNSIGVIPVHIVSIEPVKGHLSKRKFNKVRLAHGFNQPFYSSKKSIGPDSTAFVYDKYRTQVVVPNSFRRGNHAQYLYVTKAR